MKTYHDICTEMEKSGPYLTDEIGKCRRQVLAFEGTGKSRIDRYLLESATYAAAMQREPLKQRFRASEAVSGFLVWIENRKTGLTYRFPILVDEENGIVKQVSRERYGLLEDVAACLFRATKGDKLVRWDMAKDADFDEWREPTDKEILGTDDRLGSFGTESGSSRRFWQAHWRKRVEGLVGKSCLVTGCKDRRLLRAAHIKRASKSTTREKLDEYNGLILAGHIDLAFEHGLIAFADSGRLLFSGAFDIDDRAALNFPKAATLPKVHPQTQEYLRWHRNFHGFEKST